MACGKAVYKNGKVNKSSPTVEQMTRTSEHKQAETKNVRLSIDLKLTLGRANGTIRKSNVREGQP